MIQGMRVDRGAPGWEVTNVAPVDALCTRTAATNDLSGVIDARDRKTFYARTTMDGIIEVIHYVLFPNKSMLPRTGDMSHPNNLAGIVYSFGHPAPASEYALEVHGPAQRQVNPRIVS